MDSVTDFNSRSTLRNGTLTNIEDVSSSLPGVPHYAGTESIISWSQKLEKRILPPLTSTRVLVLCGNRQGFPLLFDRQGRGVNESFREDKIKLNSISLTLFLSFRVIF